MLNFTEKVDIYRPSQTIGTDLNVLPNAVSLVASGIDCNIHRGSVKAQEQSSILGIYGRQMGMALLDVDQQPHLGDRYVLVDSDNHAWVILGIPSKHNRFPQTAHMRCLVSLLKSRPAGLP